MVTSKIRCLELRFRKKLTSAVLTKHDIKAEGNSPPEVVLVDSITKKIVDFEPEASMQVEICALKGDFGDVEGGNWTSEQFNENIVMEREDIPVKIEEFSERKRKRPLLGGNTLLNLNRGKCVMKNIKFRQYSKWMKLSKFKLGARIVSTHGGIQIKEAVSDQFTVEDRRNKLYKKHDHPSLNDEVWRLKNIGKDGAYHKRLRNKNVNSVKDFLTLLYHDPTGLRNILGSSMSTKMWEATANHAWKCAHNKDQFIPNEKLSASEKANAHDLVLPAFNHRDKADNVEDKASLMPALFGLPTSDHSSNSPVIVNSACENDLDVGIDQNSSNSNFDMDSMAQVLFEEEKLRFYNPDYHLLNSIITSSTEPQSALSGFLEHPVPSDNGRKRWKMLFSAVRRILAIKSCVTSKR